MPHKTWIILPLFIALACPACAAPPGVTVVDGVLHKDGQPLRGQAIGVNYFNCFYRTLVKDGDTSYEQGFAALKERGIPFARFNCGGFWPGEWKLYHSDKGEYFRRLDGVVRSAEKHGIGLIPSLFWHTATVPDMVGEPCDQWGNPQSKTIAFMRNYTIEVVSRYKDSPAIWGWEFGNEYDLPTDLPNAAQHRPPVVPKLGTPEARTARDELTHDMVRSAFVEFAKAVRQYDPYRFITTGNSIPRDSAWHHRHEKSWKKDSPEQFAQMLAGDNPDPVNVISVHIYREAVARLPDAVAAARKAGKPLFVGEFGVQGPASDATRRQFADMLAAVEKADVPLAALWVFDFGRQDEWTVTADNERRYQLEAIADANRRMRAAS